MPERFPTLTQRPETGSIISSAFYAVLAFFSLPFLLLLFLQGSEDNMKVISIIEIIYHIINFAMAIWIFHSYLSDYFDDLRYDWKNLMKTASISSGLIFLLALVLFALFAFSQGNLWLTAFGAVPLTEVELFILPSNLVVASPIAGTLVMVFLAPLTVSCLYYATVFAPICCNRPVLAYVVMAVFLAFPRYCNAATYWDPTEQMVLYFTQLPLHLLACWSYQKTDSIWAPVLTHTVVNLLSCGLILVNWVIPFL